MSNSDHQRAGSAPGHYFFGTEEEVVLRPRVRKDGKEVRLKAYEAAQNRDALREAMLRAFMAGMPSREHKRMFKGAQNDFVEADVDLDLFRGGQQFVFGHFAGEHLVKDDAEGVNVGAVIDLAGHSDLLRRHVFGRAHDFARKRLLFRRGL